jgi:hypothetical protein
MILLTFIPTGLIIVAVFYAIVFHLYSSILLLQDTVNLLLAWIFDTLKLVPAIEVVSANLVVPSKLPENISEISVLDEFKQMWAAHPRTTQQILTLQCVWNPTLVDDSKKHFGEMIGVPGSRMVYLRVEYTCMERKPLTYWIMQLTLPKRLKFCTFYKLTSLDDPYMFPPYPPYSDIPQPQKSITPQRAVLVLQHIVEGRLRRQYSCQVTDQLLTISGPKGNYFSDSAAGNQLEPEFIFILMQHEIAHLLRRARDQIVFQRIDQAITDAHRKANHARQVLALRLRVQNTSNRVQIIELSRFLPF